MTTQQWLKNIRARSIANAELKAAGAPPNISYGEGFIVHDAYERTIFDDLRRKFPMWGSGAYENHPANSDFTTGFLQSAIGAARAVDKNTLTFSATTETRSARTPIEIKAITSDRNFGMYKRSLYSQMGSLYGDLTAKDIKDIYTAMIAEWQRQFYAGDATGSPLEFDGLKKLLATGPTISAGVSIIKTIQAKVVTMMNSTTKMVMPTHILANPVTAYQITQEQQKMKIGADWVAAPNSTFVQGVPARTLDTQAGVLPIISDPFNPVISGTTNVYSLFIVSADKLRWEYVEPLGQAGPEPKVFEFPMTTILDTPYKSIMFGALDGDGFSDHFARLNFEDRTTVIDPTA